MTSLAASRLILRAGDESTEDYPYHQAFIAWAEAIDKASNGEIKLEAYSNAVLGYDKELIDGVRKGTLDFCTTSLGALGSFAPRINILSLPYLIKDVDHLVRVLDLGLAEKMNTYILQEDLGFLSLGWLCGGSRCFYTKKPVYRVKDLVGLKIRAMENEVYVKLMGLLGAKAVPMAYGEVYRALQTGVIDGAENDFGSYYTQKHYELAPYYALDYHTMDVTVLLASAQTWQRLSATEREILIATLPVFIETGRDCWAKLTIEARRAVEKLGVTVTEVEQEGFKKAVTPLWEIVTQEYGEEFVDYIRTVD